MDTYKQLRHEIIKQLQGRSLTAFVQLWLILFSQKHSEHWVWDTISKYSERSKTHTILVSEYLSSLLIFYSRSCSFLSLKMHINVYFSTKNIVNWSCQVKTVLSCQKFCSIAFHGQFCLFSSFLFFSLVVLKMELRTPGMLDCSLSTELYPSSSQCFLEMVAPVVFY